MTKQEFDKQACFDSNDGVYRWNLNDRIPFADLLTEVGIAPNVIERCKVVRGQEDAAFIAEYREQMKNHVYSEEEKYEMRAAFGEGTTVVNVFTGQTIRV
jgi:hypothetical protein